MLAFGVARLRGGGVDMSDQEDVFLCSGLPLLLEKEADGDVEMPLKMVREELRIPVSVASRKGV